MRSVILIQWRQRTMEMIWQDLGALTTVGAYEQESSVSAGDRIIETYNVYSRENYSN